jgi:hypothetical protein
VHHPLNGTPPANSEPQRKPSATPHNERHGAANRSGVNANARSITSRDEKEKQTQRDDYILICVQPQDEH